MEFSTNNLCLSCGAYDQGRYCSHCGAVLPIKVTALPKLLTARLKKAGFEVFGKGDISTTLDETCRSFFQNLGKLFEETLLRLDMQGQYGHITVIGLISLKTHDIGTWDDIFSEIRQVIPQHGFYLTDKKIRFLQIKLYGISDKSDTNDALRPTASVSMSTRQKFQKIFSSPLIWSIRAFKVSPEKSFVGGSDWTDIDHHDFIAGLKQIAFHKETGQPKTESTLRDIAQVAYAKTVKEIYHFAVNWYRLLSRPFFTASRLRSGEMSGIEAFTFMLGSYGFGLALSSILGYKSPLSFDIYPIADELLKFMVILALAAISALILHPCFKIFRGNGRWRDTLLGQVLVMGLIIPFISVFDALLSWFLEPDALDKLHYEGASWVYAVPVFSAMHQMSPGKTFLVLIIGPLVILFLVALLVLGFAALMK